MTKKVKSLLAALLALQVTAASAEPAHKPPQMVVTGEAEVAAAPDVAGLSLRVSSLEASGAAAMAATTEKANRVLAALKDFGIEARDLQTSSLSLGPEYEYPGNNEPRRLRGYGASVSLTLRLRALDKLGPLLDLVLQESETEFEGLSFSHSDPGALRDQARAEAVREARRRATLMAEAEGLKAGKVISMREQGNDAPGMPMLRMAAPAAEGARDSLNIAPGEVTYTQRVEVVYELTAP